MRSPEAQESHLRYLFIPSIFVSQDNHVFCFVAKAVWPAAAVSWNGVCLQISLQSYQILPLWSLKSISLFWIALGFYTWNNVSAVLKWSKRVSFSRSRGKGRKTAALRTLPRSLGWWATRREPKKLASKPSEYFPPPPPSAVCITVIRAHNDFITLLRLGIQTEYESDKNTAEEVNDYLGRAIDARSIDRLRSEHCKRFFLTFRDPKVEAKVRAFLTHNDHLSSWSFGLQFSKERDKMLEAYFVCSFVIFISLFVLQQIILP